MLCPKKAKNAHNSRVSTNMIGWFSKV